MCVFRVGITMGLLFFLSLESRLLSWLCLGCTVSSGEKHLTGCVGGIDGMVLWMGIARSVSTMYHDPRH